MKVNNENERICAILHDVIEDSNITLDYLKAEGFSQDIIGTLDALTRREKESYDNYINRLMLNKTACFIKYYDLKHNMDLSRLPNLTNHDIKRNKRYKKAFSKITDHILNNLIDEDF
jgi:(p)ppGpp synthase/HD superfamily hydrolase